MKNKQIIFLIGSILFFCFSCASFYLLFMQINNTQNKVKLAEIEWQDEENRRESIKSLDRLIKKIEKEKQVLDSHFVKTADVVSFLDFFEQSGILVGAKAEVSSVNLSTEGNAILVDLNTIGTFEALYKYITLLENAPYELEILSFSFNTTTEISGLTPAWNANLKIKLLSFSK